MKFSDDIEPLVRLIENTPREKCVEMLAEKLRGGVTYRQFMAALFLAGLRSFKPAGGGAMHNVYVIHSAHQLSLDARPEERLLPLFYALDSFKRSRPHLAEDRLQRLHGVLPAAEHAWDEFDAAMEDWDGERADRAMVALVRSRSAAEIAEGLWRYGARDMNSFGHKAIFLANAWRTLETIGWQHAEPVMRALTLALANHRVKYAQPKAAYRTEFAKQPYLANVERARKAAPRLPGDWAASESDPGLTKELLALLRDHQRVEEACRLAVTQLVEGKARAGALWDAVHLAAGESIMRERDPLGNLGGVHAVTSANALHYAFRMSGRAETRLLVLLQAVGWMGKFANEIGPNQKDVKITELMPADIAASEETAAREILAAAVRPKAEDQIALIAREAAPKAFRYAQQYPEPEAFLREARRLICLKANDQHKYKYPAAIFEDYRLVDPQWRPHMLAATVYYLEGSGQPDTPIVQRTREALGTK